MGGDARYRAIRRERAHGASHPRGRRGERPGKCGAAVWHLEEVVEQLGLLVHGKLLDLPQAEREQVATLGRGGGGGRETYMVRHGRDMSRGDTCRGVCG